MNETKKCKHCQSDIPKKAKICPVCKRKQKNSIFLTLGIILLVLGLIGIVGGSNDKPTKVESNINTEILSDNASSDNTSTEVSTEITTFGIGDTAEYRGVSVTLNSIEESDGSQYNRPTDGNVFLLVNLTIENNSDSDLAVSSLLSFSAYQDGYTTNVSLMALSEKTGEQLDGTIAPGKKMQGTIAYEVPADYSEFEIDYQADMWDNQKFCFVYTKTNE